MRTTIGILLLISFIGIVSTDQSMAIPAFARKYKTSCQTCHVVYPKLTPFGEAFRLNGFRWPGEAEADEDQTKDEQLAMGAEGYKRVFPDAVWPGSIPGTPPISFRARTGFKVEDTDDETQTAFELPTLQTMLAGTFGEDVTFFIGAHLFEDGSFSSASVDRFYLQMNDLFGETLPDNLLDFKVGQFIPEMVTFASNHRGLTQTAFAFNTYSPLLGSQFGEGHAHGEAGETGAEGSGFGIELFQIGIEASGIVQNRFRYVLGLVNGGIGKEVNKAKDGYFRLSYKIGGMAFDGSGAPEETGKNWRDNSLAIGVFGYRGASINNDTFGPRDLTVERLGVDLSVYWEDLNLYGGFMRGWDQMLATTSVSKDKFDIWFTEANYVVYPWLLGVVRYEQANPDGLGTIRRVIPHISVLYRANIKFFAETRLDPEDIHFNILSVGMDFAF